MRIRFIDELKVSDEIKNFWKEKQVYTIEDLARVFLDERGRFDNDLFDEIVYKHHYSTREERAVKSAVYKSGCYRDIEGRPTDPIIYYAEVKEPNPCWHPANAPARTVIEIDRLKQELIVRYYDRVDDAHGPGYWNISTTKAFINPELCEEFFRRLEMTGEITPVLDAPNADILIRKGSGRRERCRGMLGDSRVDDVKHEILKRAYVIAD